MRHNHNSHNAIRANPDMGMTDMEPIALPEDAIITRKDIWEGQNLDLKPGSYQASWILKNKEKGKYKGCKIHTYQFTFSKGSPKSMAGNNGEFTIHSRKSGASIRSKIEVFVDQNGDGEYEDSEIMLSSGKEGYKIRDAITDYTTLEFEDALNLRKLQKSGVFTFDTSNASSSYYAPDIIFKNLSRDKDKQTSDSNQDNEFAINFIDYSMDEFVVC